MNTQSQTNQPAREVVTRQSEIYLSRKEVLARYGIGNTTLYRWMNERDVNFPKPLQMGARCVRWKQSELEAWEEKRQTDAA